MEQQEPPNCYSQKCNTGEPWLALSEGSVFIDPTGYSLGYSMALPNVLDLHSATQLGKGSVCSAPHIELFTT